MIKNYIAKLWIQLKTVRLGVWFLCVFIIYMGVCGIHFLNTPMSENQIASREAKRYNDVYNKVQPSEKVPVYDYQRYHHIKLDNRFFLIPRVYGGFEGVVFYWPLGIYEKFRNLRGPMNAGLAQEMNEATIEVFMESKYFGRSDYILKSPEKACLPENQNEQNFLWNGLKIHFRFDESHQKDWPKICLEALRILNQVKEVKP